MMYFLASACTNVTILKILYYIKQLLNIAFIGIPVLLVLMLIVDFIKALTAKDDGNQKKITSLAIKRIVYAMRFTPCQS